MKINNVFNERSMFSKYGKIFEYFLVYSFDRYNKFQMHEAEEICNIKPYEANTDTSRIYQDLNFPQRFECPCKSFFLIYE